ncbi:hypothetical protein DRH14_05380 [Candidatus Shapirobacteria bacterium]|nr:MAG: hypothetical protein DRH14_05380 [Candidatus Shapirobacteria bacterium]
MEETMVHLLIMVALVIVAITAYSVGKDDGIKQGRTEILTENMIRAEIQFDSHQYQELEAVLESIKEPINQPY